MECEIIFFIFFGSTERLHLNVAEYEYKNDVILIRRQQKNTARFICLIEVTQSVENFLKIVFLNPPESIFIQVF